VSSVDVSQAIEIWDAVTESILRFPGTDGGVTSGLVFTMTRSLADVPDLTQKEYSTLGRSPVQV
jgi:hypothetical protein